MSAQNRSNVVSKLIQRIRNVQINCFYKPFSIYFFFKQDFFFNLFNVLKRHLRPVDPKKCEKALFNVNLRLKTLFNVNLR